jgi:uncharacterized protein YbjT (DUF2867 family)
MKTAIVVGATGLVGTELTHMLLRDSRVEKVKTFVRRSANISHEKLEEHIVDFTSIDNWRKNIEGDVLYSALGTTLRAAGSKEAQYHIDYSCQYEIARFAASHGVPEYVLISSAGASPESRIFYSRIKGELERDIQKLPFETIHILRPGILDGERTEIRTVEKLSVSLMKVLSRVPGLKKYEPIKAKNVARAMINATFRHVIGIHSYSLEKVLTLAEIDNLEKIVV